MRLRPSCPHRYSLADQIVQVGHACLEAGKVSELPDSPCHLVVVTVANEIQLLTAVENAERYGICFYVFNEPDGDMGNIAACSQPVIGQQRRVFRRFPLWDHKKNCSP